MVSAGIQSKELLCDEAKNFSTSSYLLGLSYQTTYTFACNYLGLRCQAYLGGSMLRIREPKIWCTALMCRSPVMISVWKETKIGALR